jgi:hypothetical protein
MTCTRRTGESGTGGLTEGPGSEYPPIFKALRAV